MNEAPNYQSLLDEEKELSEKLYPVANPPLNAKRLKLNHWHIKILEIVNAHPEGITWKDVLQILNKPPVIH